VKLTAEELEALEAEASREIDIAEFVPLESVDPVYLDEAYYVGPDKGGAKPYHLLAAALRGAKRVGVARFVLRGKESLVLIRPGGPGLVLHTLYYHDEIRPASAVDVGSVVKPRDTERKLAVRLVEELSENEFRPEKYKDEYRARVLEVVKRKAKGKAVALAAPPATQGQGHRPHGCSPAEPGQEERGRAAETVSRRGEAARLRGGERAMADMKCGKCGKSFSSEREMREHEKNCK
jgi:DNA end-binding protein Ku